VDAAQAQLEQSQAKLAFQQAQVEQARAQVNQKEAAGRASKVDLDHTNIYTPISGTVVARNVDVGQTVAASLQAPTIFTVAEDLSKMLVYVATDESDVGNVKVGALATFRVDAFPKAVFSGRIKEVRINPTTVQNVVTYNTMIEFDNPEQKLLPGMTAYVTIPVDTATNALKVPNGALRFKPDMTEEERRAALQKAGIEMSAPGSRGMTSGEKKKDKGDQGSGDKAVKREKKQRSGDNGGTPGAEAPTGAMRARTLSTDIQLVWVQGTDSSAPMRPVQVRTGITDYTYTVVRDVLKGDLKEGDMVITGMAIPTRAATGQAGPMGMGPGGMGGARKPGK
jgi:HlyD family secretion protein